MRNEGTVKYDFVATNVDREAIVEDQRETLGVLQLVHLR